jgi:hypothetical protein
MSCYRALRKLGAGSLVPPQIGVITVNRNTPIYALVPGAMDGCCRGDMEATEDCAAAGQGPVSRFRPDRLRENVSPLARLTT